MPMLGVHKSAAQNRDDYVRFTRGGETYFRVDDTVYALTVVDGNPYFEVLGQM